MQTAIASIVIVEDEPDILTLLSDLLGGEGFSVVGFHRPFDLSALVVTPDLFVLDLMLPEGSGIEVARMLRHAGYHGTPMIAMSASEMMLEQARNSGLFQAFLPKPFDVIELLETVTHQLIS
jgi:CheY-like chemotaxis protein